MNFAGENIENTNQKRFLRIRKFDEYQHYKDRNPIWIKLYCGILEDYDFAQMSDETKFHAVGLMLLASRLNNKFPEDEPWLRQKINANAEIDLKLLLEIGFLEVIKATRKRNKESLESVKRSLDNSKPLKINGELASTEEKREEEKKREHNTTEQTADAVESGAILDLGIWNADLEGQRSKVEGQKSKIEVQRSKIEDQKSKVEDQRSKFSLAECLRYVEHCQRSGEAIKNPKGLANHIFKTGEADAFIVATLFPEKYEEIERKRYGEPRQFSDEPCRVCFGAKMADSEGKGYRKCTNCLDERGKPTGLNPFNI